MRNLNIDEALILQNPHWTGEAYQHAIKRLHDELILGELELEEILIITGIRRCGKSTLMQTLINHLILNHHPRSILYVNFDDPLYTPTYQDPSLLHELISHAEKMSGQKIEYLFLDEIQNVDGWEQYVKSVYDSRRFKKILITGSNAELLKSDYASLLTGRYLEMQIFPLTFKEVLNHHKIFDSVDLASKKPQVLNHLDFYMKYGGLPRIHCVDDEQNRIRLLKNYYETIVIKDCIQNHGIRDSKSFFNFSYYMINNLSCTFSYNSLGRALSIHENTAGQYTHIVECAYFLYELKTFSYSLKDQSRTKKKAYCIDNGLILAAAFQFSQNLGKLFENMIYSELAKQSIGDIYFYNDKKECDFIIHGKEKLAIQACYELNDQNRARELAGLEAAMNEFNIQSGMIITYNQEEKINDQILIIPFWKYFH